MQITYIVVAFFVIFLFVLLWRSRSTPSEDGVTPPDDDSTPPGDKDGTYIICTEDNLCLSKPISEIENINADVSSPSIKKGKDDAIVFERRNNKNNVYYYRATNLDKNLWLTSNKIEEKGARFLTLGQYSLLRDAFFRFSANDDKIELRRKSETIPAMLTPVFGYDTDGVNANVLKPKSS